MKALVDAVGYSERPHFDCSEQALEVVLRFHGYELEDLLFDEWRFSYWKSSRRGGGFSVTAGNPLQIRSRFSRFGVELVLHEDRTPEEALMGIRQVVMEGRPVPISVDAYYLRYYAPKNPRHAVHAVVVVGFDDPGKQVQIVDPSPWQLFKGPIAVDEFKKAIDSACHSDGKGRNSWAELRFQAELKRLTWDDVKRSIDASAKAMVIGQSQPAAVTKIGSGTVVQGIPGMRAFARDIAAWSELEEADAVRYMQVGRDQLQAVARRRYGHACFLSSMGKQFDKDQLKDTARVVGVLAKSWLLPANMILKASMKRALTQLPMVGKRIVDLADREETLIRDLWKEIAP